MSQKHIKEFKQIVVQLPPKLNNHKVMQLSEDFNMKMKCANYHLI